MEFDAFLPRLLAALHDDDVLVITADHGNDPTTPSTDHSREYVPLLMCGAQVKQGVNLGIRSSFSDLGATLAEYFGVAATPHGKSFLAEVLA
jgi:phosphopentomutase